MGAIAGTIIGGLLFMAVIVTLGLFFLRKHREGRASTPFIRQSHAVDSDIDLTYDPSKAPPVTPFHMAPSSGHPSYPYSPNSGQIFDSNPFLGSPSASQAGPLSSSYQASTYPTTPGAYEPTESPYHSSEYPPHPSHPATSHDPFNPSAPPSIPGLEFDPYAQNNADPSTSRYSTSTAAKRGKAAMAGVTPYTPSRFIVHTDAEDELPPPDADGVVELPPQYTERRGQFAVTNPTPSRPNASAGRPPSGQYPS